MVGSALKVIGEDCIIQNFNYQRLVGDLLRSFPNVSTLDTQICALPLGFFYKPPGHLYLYTRSRMTSVIPAL